MADAGWRILAKDGARGANPTWPADEPTQEIDHVADPVVLPHFGYGRQGRQGRQRLNCHRERGSRFGVDDLPVTVEDGDGRAGPGIGPVTGIGQGFRHGS